MSDLLQFSRNSRLYLQQGSNIWEIPMLDGFSFSQATNASEITLAEMSDATGKSRRARQMFNDSIAPAEWSFSSYVRPNLGSCVEEALWANFVADNSFTAGAWTAAEGGTNAVTKLSPSTTFTFAASNKTTLGTFTLYFVLGGCGVNAATTPFSAANGQTIYRIEQCVANSASIDFDIDGIAMINWSGFGRVIQEVATFDAATAITTGVGSTSNFIRNRLTSLTVTTDGTQGYATAYDIILTGGNITFENNITYLTPESLCTVNQPIGHVTGTRTITGNFTCYLNAAGTSSAELFEDLVTNNTIVRNNFSLVFSIGGSGTPRMVVNMPTCHLEIPTHSIEDVISVDTTFHALPTTMDATNEATIIYTGAA